MRIGIDARFFGPKQKGLGRYVEKLVQELTKFSISNFQFSNYKVVIFLRKENFEDFKPRAPNFKKVLADYKWYGFKEQIFLPIKIWREKVDLMHFPHFNVPIFYRGKFVVTIHDLVLKKFPTKKATTLNPLLYKIKELGYKIVLSSAVKKAKKIITPSNFTKNEILKYFKVKPEKIKVICEGAPKIENCKLKIENCKILEKYKIKKPYMLYVGNAYPHKNLEGLVSAFNKIIKDYKLEYQLVLVGEIDYFYKKIIENCKLKIENFKSIVFTGFVPDDELPELYRNALLYVSPAFCEGFGLPALEAMSYGVPVAASSGGAQPEILGEAAMYFDPKDVDDMAEKIKNLLENENLRKELVVKGHEQVKKYSWQKMAEETLGVYQSIFKSH